MPIMLLAAAAPHSIGNDMERCRRVVHDGFVDRPRRLPGVLPSPVLALVQWGRLAADLTAAAGDGYLVFMVSPESALLRVLIQGEGYGLELTRRVREWTNGKLMLDDESFYQAVQVLEEQGLVESYMSEPVGQRGGQPRRYYKLTAAGQRAALEVLTASLTGQM